MDPMDIRRRNKVNKMMIFHYSGGSEPDDHPAWKFFILFRDITHCPFAGAIFMTSHAVWFCYKWLYVHRSSYIERRALEIAYFGRPLQRWERKELKEWKGKKKDRPYPIFRVHLNGWFRSASHYVLIDGKRYFQYTPPMDPPMSTYNLKTFEKNAPNITAADYDQVYDAIPESQKRFASGPKPNSKPKKQQSFQRPETPRWDLVEASPRINRMLR